MKLFYLQGGFEHDSENIVKKKRFLKITGKETKGTLRFKPKDDTVIGNATIYLPKDFIKDQGINPEKGLIQSIVLHPSTEVGWCQVPLPE